MYQALDVMDSENNKQYFGWFNFHPPCIQVFKSMKWAVFFISMGALLQGVAVNGLLHYFIPMIERHFQLSSTKAGFMSGAYDIASLVCLIPVTYFGGQKTANKPRILGTGVFIMGAGSFIFALPAFFAQYKYYAAKTLCVEVIEHENEEINRNYTFHYALLVIGNFLHGVGASPLFTLGIIYLDENAPPNRSSIYLGIYYMMAILGPSLGYLLGGYLSNYYVDFAFIDIERSVEIKDMRPSDPSWVGCWWLGFLCCSALSFIFAVPILGYPRSLKEQKDMKMIVPKQNLSDIPSFSGLPSSFSRVLRRLKFDFITCAGFCEGLVISGMGSFFPKILEQQMGCSAQTTAMVLGAIAVPCALFGIMIGGWVIKHYRLKLDHMILFCLSMICMATVTSLALFLSCEPANITGFHIPYPSQSIFERSLYSECNKNCHCQSHVYDPVCSIDNVNYFSPCFAGCTSSTKINFFSYYMGCKCIHSNLTRDYDAINRPCPTNCNVFYLFTILLCLYQVFTFSACIPALTATLRSVETELKSLAMGIQWIVARLLGTIPGPVLFGMIFDQSCILWYTNSKSSGECLLYDHWLLSL
ncbi:organic anion transporting polypeptide 26F isoform X2 [Rhodnius prolixus]